VHYSVLDRDCAVLVQLAKGIQVVTIDFRNGKSGAASLHVDRQAAARLPGRTDDRSCDPTWTTEGRAEHDHSA
jgi:hypothetical protein